jgi:hypothetical protein
LSFKFNVVISVHKNIIYFTDILTDSRHFILIKSR